MEWPRARCEAWRRAAPIRARWAAESDALEDAVAAGHLPEGALRRSPAVTMPCLDEGEEATWREVHRGERHWRRHFQHYGGDDDTGDYGE